MSRSRPTAVLAACALAALPTARSLLAEAPAADLLAGWDAFVRETLSAWRVPGLAMAVVQGDAILVLKGYGLRDAEKKLPVTDRTLFPIGSATKAFTTFVMGTLAEDGKLDWNAPVSRWIPGFRLRDPFASERMTPTDLVTHRSGLPRHDALWYNATLSRAELVERLRWLEPSKDFRTDFQYSNLMYVVAGCLLERVAGTSWEETVRARVFAPLGMSSSNFSVLDSQRTPDFALPYGARDDTVRRMPFRDVSNVGPALSINASARDLVPWLRLHLDGGKVGGKRVASPETLADLHTPRMETGAKPTETEVVPGGYALGWFTDVYRGRRRVYDSGHIDGFTAVVMLVPTERIGIAILANADHTPLPHLLARHLIDRLLGLSPRDWNGEGLAGRTRARELDREVEAGKAEARTPGTVPAHPIGDYAGEYEHPAYGILRITVKGSRLEMTYNRIATPMEHWHDEVWSGVRKDGEDADNTFENFQIRFLTDAQGDVSGVAAPMEPAVRDIVFARRKR